MGRKFVMGRNAHLLNPTSKFPRLSSLWPVCGMLLIYTHGCTLAMRVGGWGQQRAGILTAYPQQFPLKFPSAELPTACLRPILTHWEQLMCGWQLHLHCLSCATVVRPIFSSLPIRNRLLLAAHCPAMQGNTLRQRRLKTCT